MSTAPQPATPPPATPRWQRYAVRLEALLERAPWLLPGLSFAAGWIGFLMVQRGAELARIVALLAIVGWPWLLIEPLVRRQLERRGAARISEFVINFVTQSLQQELLFFSLPLMIGATQRDAGQIIFTGLTVVAALASTVDPFYQRHIAARPLTSFAFHAYCSWIAALVVLPIVVHLPLERALPVSLAAVAAWMVLALPRLLPTLPTLRRKSAWLALLLLTPLLLWSARGHIPAAGLSVTEARIAQTIEALVPGPAVTVVNAAELEAGVVAFAAIRAPMGVAQSVVFEWRFRNQSERIAAQIHGGSKSGWRTFSRKRVFPQDPRGRWVVDILTPQGQLLERMHFFVQ